MAEKPGRKCKNDFSHRANVNSRTKFIVNSKKKGDVMDILEYIRSGKADEVDLLEYVTDNDVEIAVAAAESPLATEPVIDIAAHDADRRVRYAAVRNPNIGLKTLRLLANDEDEDIACFAKARLEEQI